MLRSSIYLALATSRLGDIQAAQNMLREARNTARQQGFAGLEAEALFGEAAVTPPSERGNKAAIRAVAARHHRHRLRKRRAAAPGTKAEAMLNEMLARAVDELT